MWSRAKRSVASVHPLRKFVSLFICTVIILKSSLPPTSPTSDPVHDLAFAPNFGRSYHLLAIASRDVKIVSLKPVSPGKDASIANHAGNYSKFEIRQIASFNEHNSQVRKFTRR